MSPPAAGRISAASEITLHVFPSPGNAGGSGATIAGFAVDDLEAVVDELSANGVGFERDDGARIRTDEKAFAVVGGSKGAWSKDPDGNVLGIIQV